MFTLCSPNGRQHHFVGETSRRTRGRVIRIPRGWPEMEALGDTEGDPVAVLHGQEAKDYEDNTGGATSRLDKVEPRLDCRAEIRDVVHDGGGS